MSCFCQHSCHTSPDSSQTLLDTLLNSLRCLKNVYSYLYYYYYCDYNALWLSASSGRMLPHNIRHNTASGTVANKKHDISKYYYTEIIMLTNVCAMLSWHAMLRQIVCGFGTRSSCGRHMLGNNEQRRARHDCTRRILCIWQSANSGVGKTRWRQIYVKIQNKNIYKNIYYWFDIT